MRMAVLTALVCLLPVGAQADIIKCMFTEPFVNMTYSMTQSRMVLVTPEGTETVDNVSFQILGPASFELRDANNAPLITLNLDNLGSDGMSDAVYPYSAVWASPQGTLNGGCSSNLLPATVPE